jgi:predicted nuclease of predicted toxin-antitoxin system
VTLDKDFGELAVVHRQTHAGIVRLVGFSAREQARVLLLVLTNYKEALLAGALITVDNKRVRVRPPEQ